MPEVFVYALEGRSLEQKRGLVKDITDAVVRNFDVPSNTVVVQIIESSRESKSRAGILFADLANDQPNVKAEISALDEFPQTSVEKIKKIKGIASSVSERFSNSIKSASSIAANAVSDAYTATLSWKDNAELSTWLTKNLSSQHATVISKAMDAEYLRTHIGGGWHRLYDGGHSIAGSWKAVTETLPDLSIFDRVGIWANEYWKDLITTRGMPIVLFDHGQKVSDYIKHFDSVNVAEILGGQLTGVAIYCNWNDPEKLVASAASSDFSGIYFANVIAPLVSLIGLGRAYFLLKESEQQDLTDMIEPALRGLTRSGATILLITVVPGGFLIHLSSGIVISLAHNYIWESAKENKELLLLKIKERVSELGGVFAGNMPSTEPLHS